MNNITSPAMPIGQAAFPTPQASGLEYGAPARGPWNIVHIGMLMPESHQIFVCAPGCLRGVVLTAAEMGAQNRFSTVAIREHNVEDGDMERQLVEGVADIVAKLQPKPRAVLVFTSCIHHFTGCDIPLLLDELRARFPGIDFTDCYMTPTLRKTISPDSLMRKQLYSLLRLLPTDKAINLIGSNVPLAADAELRLLAADAGYTIRDICTAATYDEYLQMGASQYNISILPAAAAAGAELAQRLAQPHIYLPTSYDLDEIDRQLNALATRLGLAERSWSAQREAAKAALAALAQALGGAPLAIDYTATPRPAQLARLLAEAGCNVTALYVDSFLAEDEAAFRWLQQHVPQLEVYPTLEPRTGLLAHQQAEAGAGSPLVAIGQKAAWFSGTRHLVNLLEGGGLHGYSGIVSLAEMIATAAVEQSNVREIIQVKGWGCCG